MSKMLKPDGRCPQCHHRLVRTDPDEAEHLDLPAMMCKCAVERHVERLAAEGWVLASNLSTSLRAKLGVPVRHNVAEYRTPKFLGFGAFIPEWASFLFLAFTEQELKGFAPLVTRIKNNQTLAAVLATIGRTSGAPAVRDYIFAGLDARSMGHETCDLPDEGLTDTERAARSWGRQGS